MTTTDVLVRLAGPDDLPALRALRHEVFVVGQGVPVELEIDEHDEAVSGTCEHAVALRDGRVVGTGRLLAPGLQGADGVALVQRMAVAAGERGAGTGAALLALLERRALERGWPVVELHAQVHALGFYERAGYTAVGEPYDEAGIAHVTMRRTLA